MLSLPAIFLTSFLAALSGALMPGPLFTVTVAESPRRGSATGPLLVAGHAILEFSLVLALYLGLARFLKHPAVFTVTALVGALMLLYMATGMFRALPKLSLAPAAAAAAPSHPLVLTGILMSLANPYWTVWWITIGLPLIGQSQNFGIPGLAFFYAGHILADLLWYASISTAVAKGRRLLSDRLYRGLTAACAAFLVFFALFFLYSAFRPPAPT